MENKTEKEHDVQLEDASSGDVVARDEIGPGPPYDKMNLQAFLAIAVSIAIE